MANINMNNKQSDEFTLLTKTYIEFKQLETLINDINDLISNSNKGYALFIIIDDLEVNIILELITKLEEQDIVKTNKRKSTNIHTSNLDMIEIYKSNNYEAFTTELSSQLQIKTELTH